jgi:hypothetical protein
MHREGPTEKLRRSASIPVGRVERCLSHGRWTRIGVCGLSVGNDMAESQQDRSHSQELSHEVRARKTCDNLQRFYRSSNSRAAGFAPAHPVLFGHAFTYNDRWYNSKLAETDTCCAL